MPYKDEVPNKILLNIRCPLLLLLAPVESDHVSHHEEEEIKEDLGHSECEEDFDELRIVYFIILKLGIYKIAKGKEHLDKQSFCPPHNRRAYIDKDSGTPSSFAESGHEKTVMHCFSFSSSLFPGIVVSAFIFPHLNFCSDFPKGIGTERPASSETRPFINGCR